MTTRVTNIKSNSYPISKTTIELFQQLGAHQHLPVCVPKDMSFELHDTTTEFVNGLKRCMNAEIPVLIMDFDTDNIFTDDDYIIGYEIQKRINLIAIRQISNLHLELNAKNETDEIIPVFSRDIKEVAPESKNNEIIFSATNIICYLRPGKMLKITNIGIKSGTSYIDGAAYSFPGKMGYECIDVKESAKSSLIAEPTAYKLTIPRQKFVEPVHIVKLALSTLKYKLERIEQHVKNNIEEFYSVDNVEITRMKDLTRYKLIGETYTIGNMLARYGYLSDPSMPHIHCIKKHPSHNYVFVEIHHPDPKSIMLQSIESCKKEITSVMSAF